MDILIVDDHALFAEGLRLILRRLASQPNIEIASDFQTANTLVEKRDFDIITLDLYMPGIDGYYLLDSLKSVNPNARFLYVSSCDNPVVVNKLIAKGASGFLSKAAEVEEILFAMERVSCGDIYLPPEMEPYLAMANKTESANPVGERTSALNQNGVVQDRLEKLTPRQKQVLRLIIMGKSNKEISLALRCTEATVKSHITVIMKLLGAKNRTEAVWIARQVDVD